MNHWIMIPVILPLLLGAVLAWLSDERATLQRRLSLAGSLALLAVSLLLMQTANQEQVQIYSLGNWSAPFGIVLVLDRLSALMVLTTAVLAALVNGYACAGDDKRGRYFHALFQFQIAGICGAFLTGDLFNLFVFFEILLIASYALLLHGGGSQRLRSAVHYVVLNLVGSTLFLLGAGLVYGISGTLNMADIARFVQQAEGDSLYLMHAAGWILILVFGLKAALLPLHFWLPRAYASATAPVAALFAVMTKVGLYAILRFVTLIYAAEADAASAFDLDLLFAIALLTLLLGALGAFAADTLHSMLAWLVLVSVGTLLAGISLASEQSIAASLYYLLHSTWGIAGMFLLADLIARQRGKLAARLRTGPPLLTPARLGALFFVGAIATAGLPPFSGFIGKLSLLQSASGPYAAWLWPALLLAGFVVIVALSRAGSQLFWQQGSPLPEPVEPLQPVRFATALLLTGSAVLLLVAAGPVLDYCLTTAQQLLQPELYLKQLEGG
ncbi:monovalent cation/H+ antiporter subunit D [Thiopseudomonas denitrificans]|uniref:Multisubunit potassium/proton antiporter PhaD subunit n=1 Tax=Thiopseudomonas denitrificans TaxID=1501432 RepID=A0A4R6U666_9GAMM|nr:monovalent cation/H+ antiporter subunit D [Thiopseudomonas denitrificans]TDQ40015.1 multisubunit potassium/proton antiporter PhaD subunit [Thiopseudomonas denitrificans]